MPSPDDDDPLAPTVLTLRIITLALAMGVLGFLAITVFALRAKQPFAADPLNLRGMLTLMALVYAAAALIGHKVIRDAVVTKQIAALARGERPGEVAAGTGGETAALVDVYRTSRILGMAILEGAAFFAAVAYFIEGSAACLGAAMGLIGLILLGFPTRSAFEDWLDRHRARLRESRQFGG